jgi:hypothetical protein
MCSKAAKSHCGKCGVAQYCTSECQVKHWHGVHKSKCGKLTVEEYIRLYVSTMDIEMKKRVALNIFRKTKYPLYGPFLDEDMTEVRSLLENQKEEEKLFVRKVQNFTGAKCVYSKEQRCWYYMEVNTKKWIFEPKYAKLFKAFIEHQKFMKKAGKSCYCGNISKEFCMIGLKSDF